jgi:hypothetical protein
MVILPKRLIVFVLLISFQSVAIEDLISPLLTWEHVQTVFSSASVSSGKESKVFYIYKKTRSTGKEQKFLVCSYPRVFGFSLESEIPASNCFTTGKRYNTEELERLLHSLANNDDIENCGNVELLYEKIAPSQLMEHIFSEVTFLPKSKIFNCDISKNVEPIIAADGSLSVLRSADPSLSVTSGESTSVQFLNSTVPSFEILSKDENYIQRQKLPCFPDEVIETQISFNDGVYEEANYGSEEKYELGKKKKSLYGRILKIGKSIPGFKGLARKEILNQLDSLEVVRDLQPTRTELKEMVNQVTLASSSSQASENMYVFGATLILQRLIKQKRLPLTGANGEKFYLCETLDESCHKLMEKSLHSFKNCLSKNISFKSGPENCTKEFTTKAIGQIAFDLSEFLLDDFIGDENAELLCLDKQDRCDENFCSKKNCVEQAMIVLKQKAKNEMRKCFKTFNPQDKKGEPMLLDRLYSCVVSGLISSSDYLTRVGGPKRVLMGAKIYLDKHNLNKEAQELVENYFSKQGIRGCLGDGEKKFVENFDSDEVIFEGDSINYQVLSKISQEEISERLFSCVDDISFGVTKELMELVLPYEVGNSIMSVVDDVDSRVKIVAEVSESLLGIDGDFQKCAEDEVRKSKEERNDDDSNTNYAADPERCLSRLTLAAYFETVTRVIESQVGEIKTSEDRINEVLGDGFLLTGNGQVEGEWKDNLLECQAEKKEEIQSNSIPGVELGEMIESAAVECSILGIGDASKIITVDELVNHPKIREYDITLGYKYEEKIAESVKKCIISEFKESGVKTIDELGEVFPKAKKKCQDLAIFKTLHPEVTKSIIKNLLEEELENTGFESLIPTILPKIHLYYECNYFQQTESSSKFRDCVSLYDEFELDKSSLSSKGLAHADVMDFLEGDLKDTAYKIVFSEILKKEALSEVKSKLLGDSGDTELNDSEKKDVLETIKSNQLAARAVTLFKSGKDIDEIKSTLKAEMTKALAPKVLKHTLLRKNYSALIALNAQSGLYMCLSPIEPSDLNKTKVVGSLQCSNLDICVSKEVLSVAKKEASKKVDSTIESLGTKKSFVFELIKSYGKMKAKEYIGSCIEKQITCEDYETFAGLTSEAQQLIIASCLLSEEEDIQKEY